MQVSQESLAAGDFLVIRSFGKTRLLRVTSRSRYVRGLGWHVRVRRMSDDPAVRYMVKRLKIDLSQGGYLFWLTPYGSRKYRLFDMLTGQARLHGFTTEAEARHKVALLPDFDVEPRLLRALKRLPEWLQPFTLIMVMELRSVLRSSGRLPL